MIIELMRSARSSRHVALGIITLVITFSYIDRIVLAVLVEPIKTDLGLNDLQIGLLTGAAFAIFYALTALPVARLAERYNRVFILTVAVIVWSIATVFCGLAASFLLLVLARILVGLGEASAVAPSHSMISDLFSVQQRATALAVLAMGEAVGMGVAPMVGAWLESMVGWRGTLVMLGLATLPLAFLLLIFVREPVRGQADGIVMPQKVFPMGKSVAHLLRRRSFVYLITATCLMALTHYGALLWTPSFLHRSFHISFLELGGLLIAFQGIPYLAGTLAGGLLCDKLSRRDRRWMAWLPMLGVAVTAPATFAFLMMPNLYWTLAVLAIPSLVNGIYVAPTYAMIQNLSAVHSRATATAILVFSVYLIGAGMGPFLIGMISTQLSASYGDDSLRHAFFFLIPIYLLAAIAYGRTGRSLRADMDDARQDSLDFSHRSQTMEVSRGMADALVK